MDDTRSIGRVYMLKGGVEWGVEGVVERMSKGCVIPSSWMIREALAGSDASLDRVSPMHRRMIGSVSDERLWAACTEPRETISTRQAREAGKGRWEGERVGWEGG